MNPFPAEEDRIDHGENGEKDQNKNELLERRHRVTICYRDFYSFTGLSQRSLGRTR